MKSNKLITMLVIIMSMPLISCGGDKSEPQQTAAKQESKQQVIANIVSYIPADTPILAIYYKDPENPIPENLKSKMKQLMEGLGSFFKLAIEENMKKYGEESNKSNEVTAFMDKWLSDEGLKKLGISFGENEIAIYAIDLFPVMRITLAEDHAIDEAFDELIAKANESKADSASKKDVDGKTVYQFGDKELQLIVSVVENSLVGSLAPTREVDKLMHKLLGFEKPSKMLLQSNQYQDIISKYNYLENNIYWVNLRQVADYFVNPDQHETVMLDMLEIQDNLLSADCKTEILGLFDKFPRLLGGYTEMGEYKMSSQMVIEMKDGLGSKLASIVGRLPKSSTKDAILSYGFSFDIAKAKELALEFVTAIDANPYKCEFMSTLNLQAKTIKAKLEQPLPMFVDNFKGANVIVDELELDLSKTAPKEMIKKLKAKILLAVDSPEVLQGMAEMMVPGLQELGIKAGGDAINISELIPIKGTLIPIDLDHVFFAMGNETIALSLGEGSDVELVKDVAVESEATLLDFTITADLYKKFSSGFDQLTNDSKKTDPTQSSLQEMLVNDMIWWNSESGKINFTDNGLEIQVDINY